MNILEKILEEIEEVKQRQSGAYLNGDYGQGIEYGMTFAQKIIREHIKESNMEKTMYLNANMGDVIKCEFDKEGIYGTLQIKNRIFNVYLGECKSHCIVDCPGKPPIKKMKHTFMLIEI